MTPFLSLVSGVKHGESLTAKEVSAFERLHQIELPESYRRFLIEVANGAQLGPAYGLLALGEVPWHWSGVHCYEERLTKSFPLQAEWVWEDEPDEPDLASRVDRVQDGVLLLGEQGCGARWVLVVRGPQHGSIWLSTGEGATPVATDFSEWLTRLVDTPSEWFEVTSHWGPERNIWLASHAIKQIVTNNFDREEVATEYRQDPPICDDCQLYLARLASFHRRSFQVISSEITWHFSADGAVAAAPSDND